MSWAIRRCSGGVDINGEMADDPSLFGPTYGEWIEVVRLSEREGLAAENERLRDALRQCRNTDDEHVYRVAGAALRLPSAETETPASSRFQPPMEDS